MTTTEFQVTGMTCGHCEQAVSQEVGQIAGVAAVENAADPNAHARASQVLGQLAGKALMIHAGGDNYSDEPKPLGGGGARVACGVIR